MTEEEILEDLKKYVDSKKRNRSRVLASLKKNMRTKKIIDFIFSDPYSFKLEQEIKFVPEKLLTDELLMRVIIHYPKTIDLISDEHLSLPVMLAYEISKRFYETYSARTWGKYGDKIGYPEKIKEYQNALNDMGNCIYPYVDRIPTPEEIIPKILAFCQSKEKITKDEQITSRFGKIYLTLEKPLLILISGEPDAGKTYISHVLTNYFYNAQCFDSDMLLEDGLIEAPLKNLINTFSNVIIFSDLYANRFFSENETKDFIIVNLIIKPSSLEDMYRHSKYKQGIPFNDYVKYEANKVNNSDIEDPIIIKNDYTKRIIIETDKAIEEILIRLNLDFKNGPSLKKTK